MYQRLFAVLAVMVLPLTLVTPIFSQQNPATKTGSTLPEQDDTIRVGTAVVQIEALVTDKSGKHINGLTVADFLVLDEGKLQNIDFFHVIRGSRVVPTEDRASTTAEVGKTKSQKADSPLINPYYGRHIALVFDDLNLAPENFLRARRALADYINNKLTPNDMAAVISTAGARGSLQQFTNDKQRLLSALNRIAAMSSLSERVAAPRFRITAAEAIRIDSGDQITLERVKARVSAEELAAPQGTIIEQSQGLRTGGRGGGHLAPSPVEGRRDALDSAIRGAARAMLSQIGNATRANLKTLENIFRGMADLPGRKIVAFFTESLITAGGTSEDVSAQLAQLIELARRSGVSLYAVDAGGLRTDNVTASERMTSLGAFLNAATPELTFSNFEQLGAARVLVAGTGGDIIANTNDIANGLDRAVEDSGNYYVLGFKPAALDNKFHRLTVKVKGKTDLVIRTRRGYFAVNQETIRGTETELEAALTSPIPRIDLPLELVANVVPSGPEQVIIVGMHLGRNYLTLPPTTATDQTVNYELVAWVFAAGRDQPVGIIKRTLTFDLAKEIQAREKLKTAGLLYVPEQTLKLPPGLYQIRAAARESTSRAVGTAYQFFEVPDTNHGKIVSLSSLVLTPAGQTNFDGMNSFKAAKEVDVRYIIYGLPKDTSGLTQRVRLLDAQGRALMDSPLALSTTTPPNDPRQAQQGTRFQVPATRGRYALIVNLRDAKGKIDVERRTDFVVD